MWHANYKTPEGRQALFTFEECDKCQQTEKTLIANKNIPDLFKLWKEKKHLFLERAAILRPYVL